MPDDSCIDLVSEHEIRVGLPPAILDSHVGKDLGDLVAGQETALTTQFVDNRTQQSGGAQTALVTDDGGIRPDDDTDAGDELDEGDQAQNGPGPLPLDLDHLGGHRVPARDIDVGAVVVHSRDGADAEVHDAQRGLVGGHGLVEAPVRLRGVARVLVRVAGGVIEAGPADGAGHDLRLFVGHLERR